LDTKLYYKAKHSFFPFASFDFKIKDTITWFITQNDATKYLKVYLILKSINFIHNDQLLLSLIYIFTASISKKIIYSFILSPLALQINKISTNIIMSSLA